MGYRLWIIGLALVLVGCAKTAPQRLSHRKGEEPKVDSTSLALLELNQQLAFAADRELAKFAQAQPESYALYDASTWIHILERAENGTEILYGETCTVHMRTYDLKGHLLLDSEGMYQLGKLELPLGVEANIHELRHGDKARLLTPWYAAYGQQGTAYVAPYENVIIEIEVK